MPGLHLLGSPCIIHEPYSCHIGPLSANRADLSQLMRQFREQRSSVGHRGGMAGPDIRICRANEHARYIGLGHLGQGHRSLVHSNLLDPQPS